MVEVLLLLCLEVHLVPPLLEPLPAMKEGLAQVVGDCPFSRRSSASLAVSTGSGLPMLSKHVLEPKMATEHDPYTPRN